ncbi:MAG TPA: HAMP domain-containing sensor histidine kinase [Solirubrobacteraceae bacterium]|nr:HAMP domain-containing sensor histidine kinase [Solirubrobacteraceae bacterium]
MSLRLRMGLAAGVAVAVAVIAVAVSAYAGTRSELRGQLDNNLRTLAHPVLVRACVLPGPRPPAGVFGDEGGDENASSCSSWQPGDQDEGLGLDRQAGQAFGGASGTFTLVRRDGSAYRPSGQQSVVPPDSRAQAVAASGHGQYFVDRELSGHHVRVLVTGLGRRGALEVALPLGDVENALHKQVILLAIIAAAGVLLAALLGLLVASTALAPIARFTRQTEMIAKNPDRIETERLDVHGGDELARLADAFNDTLDALERSVHAQRNLVADASHELRTPIASIRANLQLMRDEALLTPADREALRADVIEELDQLTALVADVVELARGSKPEVEPGEVRLDEIAAESVQRFRRRAPELVFDAELEPTVVRGDGERIARAVANLLDNAAKWSPAGGAVEVALRCGELTVRDHGPGFEVADLPFVFDRFHRAERARSKPGSGLGLAIVRQAAEAHGGFARAANAPGGGALLTVSFGAPLAAQEMRAETPVSAEGLAPAGRHPREG